MTEIARAFYRAGDRFGRFRALPNLKVTVERPRPTPDSRGPLSQDFFAYAFPGLVLFALMFIGQALAARLLRDRVRGLQRRIGMTPLPRWQIAAGGVLYMIVASLAILALLGVIGSAIFNLQLRQPLALVALALAFAAFVTGLHLTVNGVARSDRGAQAVSGVVIMVLSLPRYAHGWFARSHRLGHAERQCDAGVWRRRARDCTANARDAALFIVSLTVAARRLTP